VKRPALALTALFAVALLAGSPKALAADGYSKPRESQSRLALKQVNDATGEQTVMYRVETYDGYDNVRDFSIMRWYFDLNGDGKYADMCIRLQSVGDGRLRAEFYPKCGGFVWSTAEARKPAPNVVEFSLLIRDLINGGGVVPGRPFGYRVETEDFNGRTDWIPDRGVIRQAPLPHMSVAELTGRAAGPGERSSTEAARSASESSGKPATSDWLGGHFAVLGGLPIVWLLLLTLVIVAVGAVVWRRASRRLFPSPQREPESSIARPDIDA